MLVKRLAVKRKTLVKRPIYLQPFLRYSMLLVDCGGEKGRILYEREPVKFKKTLSNLSVQHVEATAETRVEI